MIKIINQSIALFAENIKSLSYFLLPIIITYVTFTNIYFNSIDEETASFTLNFIPSIIGFPVHAFMNAGIIYLVSSKILSKEFKLKHCYTVALRHYLYILAAMLYMAIPIALGFLLLLVPGFYLFARLSLMECLIVLEGYKPVDALKESYYRTKEYVWQLLGAALIMTLILAAIDYILRIIMKDILFTNVVTSIITEVLLSLINTIPIILYFYFYLLIKSTSNKIVEA